MSSENIQEVTEKDNYITMAEFLESIPPNRTCYIKDLSIETRRSSVHSEWLESILKTPEIQLHCSNNACNGLRFFRCTDNDHKSHMHYEFYHLNYKCSNCQEYTKTFSLSAKVCGKNETEGEIYKLGEFPVYGPPTPTRLLKLIGPDREIFLKGRRSENQGLGIGSFIYYRRVVENQKDRILREIIKVSLKNWCVR